jgi:hypothetical protein
MSSRDAYDAVQSRFHSASKMSKHGEQRKGLGYNQNSCFRVLLDERRMATMGRKAVARL